MTRPSILAALTLAASSMAVAAGAQMTTPATPTPPAAPAAPTTQMPSTPQTMPTARPMSTTQTAPTTPAAPSTQTAPAAPTGQPAPTTTATPATGTPVTVGGAPMLPTRTIVENASAANNLTTLVKAVQAADLTATLSGPGPFTVFAPTDAAFGRLAPGTVDTLLKPESKPALVKLLTYHVVAGKLDGEAIKAQIEQGGGTATLTTVEGQPLKAALENGAVTLTDVSGTKTYVTQYDVEQSNGVVHVVNGVLVPKLD